MTARWNPRSAGDTAANRLAAQIAHELGAGRAGFSRRGLFRASGGAALGLSGAALLSSCGTEGKQQTDESCKSTDLSESEPELLFSNWPGYMDLSDDEKRMPTLEDFEKATGIDVTYTEDVNDNNQFFAKVQNQLGDCQSSERDIFVLTDWMAAKMITLGWIQELDYANMPNVKANLVDSLADKDWDRGRARSVPWQSGLTGIAYNAKYTGEISSFEELVTRKDLKGKISLLSEMGDTMSFMLKLVGADPNKFSADEWTAALEKLEEVVASGQVRKFTGNDYTRPLNKGDIVACEAWSGDVISMQADNPDIQFVTPEEGLALWSDNMMVPNKATHKANAEKLMDYYYDPEVAARLAAWVNYICPVDGAQEAMKKIDKSLVDAELIFPSEETLSQTFGFMATDTKTRTRYDKEFNKVIGA